MLEMVNPTVIKIPFAKTPYFENLDIIHARF